MRIEAFREYLEFSVTVAAIRGSRAELAGLRDAIERVLLTTGDEPQVTAFVDLGDDRGLAVSLERK